MKEYAGLIVKFGMCGKTLTCTLSASCAELSNWPFLLPLRK